MIPSVLKEMHFNTGGIVSCAIDAMETRRQIFEYILNYDYMLGIYFESTKVQERFGLFKVILNNI